MNRHLPDWLVALLHRYLPHGYVQIVFAWLLCGLLDWRMLTIWQITQDTNFVLIPLLVTLFVLTFTLGIIIRTRGRDL